MEKARESTACPYCLSPIEEAEEYVRCPVCGVAHHAECWRMNGKCSIYGCDGWQAWSSEIADKIAPRLKGDLNLEEDDLEPAERGYAGPVCINCGAPVKSGQITCKRCGVKGFRFFDSCFGAGVIILGGIVGIVTLLLKGLS